MAQKVGSRDGFEICNGQNGTVTGFSPSTWRFHFQCHSTNALYSFTDLSLMLYRLRRLQRARSLLHKVHTMLHQRLMQL